MQKLDRKKKKRRKRKTIRHDCQSGTIEWGTSGEGKGEKRA
jgi:hypothetical protein